MHASHGGSSQSYGATSVGSPVTRQHTSPSWQTNESAGQHSGAPVSLELPSLEVPSVPSVPSVLDVLDVDVDELESPSSAALDVLDSSPEVDPALLESPADELVDEPASTGSTTAGSQARAREVRAIAIRAFIGMPRFC